MGSDVPILFGEGRERNERGDSGEVTASRSEDTVPR